MLLLPKKPLRLIKRIGIIGCGWLGMPLGKYFVKQGYEVHGSTQNLTKTDSIRKNGIIPYVVAFPDAIKKLPKLIESVDLLILNIPPNVRNNPKGFYQNTVQQVIASILHRKIHVLFISSTSVYGDITGVITEDNIPSPKTQSALEIYGAEKLLRDSLKDRLTILRFAGLIGPNRHPIHSLSGRTDLKNGQVPVNLIHLQDCIAIIHKIIAQEIWGTTFHAAYPWHPSKETYYTAVAHKLNLPVPMYESNSTKGKIIDSSKLMKLLPYQFIEKI